MDIIMDIKPHITAGLLCFFSIASQADVLLIDVINKEPPNTAAGLLRPTHGMSMLQVEKKYGEPVKKHEPIGEPPITRWDYKKYAVYFEKNIVLRAVINQPAKATKIIEPTPK